MARVTSRHKAKQQRWLEEVDPHRPNPLTGADDLLQGGISGSGAWISFTLMNILEYPFSETRMQGSE
jgi:hypothetical protein